MKQNIRKIAVTIATVGGIGYLPAPGTFATLLTLPYVYYTNSLCIYNFSLMLITLIGFIAVSIVVPVQEQTDPSEIVIDEVAGTLITFIGIQISLSSMVIGFVLFRFFDIRKPFFIRSAERLPGAYGIMIDDIIAGVISNVILRFIFCS